MQRLMGHCRSVILLISCFMLIPLAGCSPKPNPKDLVPAARVISPSRRNAENRNQKISAQVYAVMKKVEAAPAATPKKKLSTLFVHVNAAGEIQIYVYVTAPSPAIKARLISSGLNQLQSVPQLAIYQAWGSPAAIEHAASLKKVTQITAPIYAFKKRAVH